MKLLFLDIDGVLNSHRFYATRVPKEGDPHSPENLRMARKIRKRMLREGYDPPSQSVMLEDLRGIDRASVTILNDFLRRSGVKVVISSTWRKTYPWEIFETILTGTFGFEGKVIGQTPHNLPRAHHGPYASTSALRGDEIQDWLDRWGKGGGEPIESFVIFDDDTDMAHLHHRLIRTDIAVGLTPEDVERALALLET